MVKHRYPYRSRRLITHHGRTGYPLIHEDKRTGKTFIMVRKKGGGTKRKYNYWREVE